MIAGGDRSLHRENVVDIGLDQAGKTVHFLKREFVQFPALCKRVCNGFSGRLMGVAKGKALSHQVVGEIGGGCAVLSRRLAHDLAPAFDGGNQFAKGEQAVLERVDQVEDGSLSSWLSLLYASG